MKHRQTKLIITIFFTVAAIFLMRASASAFTDLTITGSSRFDVTTPGIPTLIGSVTNNGDYSVIEGGATTTETFSGVTPAATNPLPGTFTAIGDGVGGSAILSATDPAEYDFAIFFNFDLINTSGSDTYKVTFEADFTHTVDADGPDAFGESTFDLESPIGTNLLHSEIVSDTFFGDEKNGLPLPTLGDPVTDSGVFSFDITLLPGATSDIEAFYNWTGETFEELSGVSSDFTGSILITNVMNLTPPDPNPIPEPSTYILVGIGISALFLWNRKRKLKAILIENRKPKG